MPPTLSVYAATPRISLDGSEQSALTSHLVELASEETVEGLARCEATFSNWGPKDNAVGYLFSDRRILDFGKALKVEARDGQGIVFEGRIMGLEGRYARDRAPELLVLAEDRFQDLRMKRRSRTFEDINDSDLFNRIASDYGLQPNVDVDGPTHKVLAQINQSDLAFVRERARAVDADVWFEDNKLNVVARSRRHNGDVKLTFMRELFDCTILADLACQFTAFRVTGWDVEGKQAIEYEASDSVIGGELNGNTSGSSELQRALGERKQQVVHRLPLTSQEAQSLAEGEFRRMARRFLRGECLAQGDTRVKVGTFVELDGLGPLYDGKYYVTRVRHSFSMQLGFRTALSVERPGIAA